VVFGTVLVFSSVFAAPNVTLTPSSQNISAGGKAVIKIISSGATRCTVTGGKYSGSNTLLNGNVLLTPTVTTKYTFTCYDSSNDMNIAQATINVTNAAGNGTTGSNGSGNATTNASNNGSGSNAPLSNSNRPQTSAPSYGNGTIMTEANSICSAYSGFRSVYNTPQGAGGSSVPVDQTNQYLPLE
jgi:hypothetical protein